MTFAAEKLLPFLLAIVNDPADTFVRLIFADFLEEYGDSKRAQFLRDTVRFPFGPWKMDDDSRLSIHRVILHSVEMEPILLICQQFVEEVGEGVWMYNIFKEFVKENKFFFGNSSSFEMVVLTDVFGNSVDVLPLHKFFGWRPGICKSVGSLMSIQTCSHEEHNDIHQCQSDWSQSSRQLSNLWRSP